MTVFENYARFYDLLYGDKPYKSEADYIRHLILKHNPQTRVLVELGCGTGIHAEHLANSGMEVHGVDLSAWMLGKAETRRSTLEVEIAKRLHFKIGDVRDVRLNLQADTVISLFHVMSYQTSKIDLQAMFRTAREHLKPGGVFIFDVWYGPAVLSNPPSVRVKRFEDDEFRIVRVAEPILYPDENLVDVNYHIIVCEKKTSQYSEIHETHRMRYLFSPEIEMYALDAGFTVVESQEWMTAQKPGIDTWGVCFICKA